MAVARVKFIGIRETLTSLLPKAEIERLARESGAMRRRRKVDPSAMFWCVVLGFGTGSERTLAGLRRSYERATGKSLVPSSFYDRFTPGLARMFRAVLAQLMRKLASSDVRYGGVLEGFRDVLAADATVVKVHRLLARRFPGTRTNSAPAAAKLHLVMSVRGTGVHKVKVTGERAKDHRTLQMGPWVEGRLLLFDLGYFRYQLFDCIDRNGGYFITRLAANANPRIVAIHRQWRGRAIDLEGKRLKEVASRLQREVNEIVRERLARDGVVHGPAMETERLASRGYTDAEKALARNYRPGDVVGFHRPYKRLGVEKGDELRIAGVDAGAGTVSLAGTDGGTVSWEPGRLAARAGGVEVYKVESMELRAGDRIRWTRNDAGLGLVNSQTAEVTGVADGRVSFRLEDGRMLDMNGGDPQLRHIDRAWASTVHAFQGRTVDNVIAAIEANHPNLTNQKMLYVEISRARDRAELVTDDKAALAEQLQALTGERMAALEAVGEEKAKAPETGKVGGMDAEIGGERSTGRTTEAEKLPEPKSVDRDLGL